MTDTERTELPTTEEEWRSRLTPEQFEVFRREGTERAFTGIYWNEKEPGYLSLRRVRHSPLLVGHQIRLRDRMAQLLGAGFTNRHRDPRRLQHRDGPHRGALRHLPRPPRARLPRWPPTVRSALLHELCGTGPRAKLDGRRQSRSVPRRGEGPAAEQRVGGLDPNGARTGHRLGMNHPLPRRSASGTPAAGGRQSLLR